MFTVVVPDNPPIWPPISLAWMTTWYCSLFSRSMFSKAVLIIPENIKTKEGKFTNKVLTSMEILIKKHPQSKEQNNFCVISKICPGQIFTAMRRLIKLQTFHIIFQAAAYVTDTILVASPETFSTYLWAVLLDITIYPLSVPCWKSLTGLDKGSLFITMCSTFTLLFCQYFYFDRSGKEKKYLTSARHH